MPCFNGNFQGTADASISDYLELHIFTADQSYRPQDKADLVAAVVKTAQASRSLRALGTNYSLSKAAVADDVIDTSALSMHVGQPFPAGVSPLPGSRLRNGGSRLLASLCASDGRAAGRHFVHVEAGIKIRDLLADLKSCGLSLPTMGAGGAQSLAGALSTATHGADFRVPSLVEWIQAIHLVGAGGQEWWITPAKSIFADERVMTMPDWCDDARIVADDDAFDAVRVGVGRIGVIYSMVLEVVPAYGLLEVNFEHRWSEIRKLLSASRLDGGGDTGIFAAPLSDLESGWFRTQLLTRSRMFYPYGFRFEHGPPQYPEPPYTPWAQQHLLDTLGIFGLGDLARDLRGGMPMPLHHINIAVNLARPEQCWVTRRWRREGGIRSVQLDSGPRDPIVQALIDNKRNPIGIVEPIRQGVGPCDFILTLGEIFASEEALRFEVFKEHQMPRIASESTTSGEALFLILYKLATDPILRNDARSQVIDGVSKVIGGAFITLARAGLATDILDTHDYSLDGAQSGDSVEFFFDASGGDHLSFIDAVIDLSNKHSPVFGYMGIRFTPRSSALIAMQQFDLSVSVEISTARARQEDVYADFWDDVHAAAADRRGIPHWGQELRQSTDEIANHYGTNLGTWRRMLAELSIDSPQTFSTDFSRIVGLEPTDATGIFDCDAVAQFVAGLAGDVG
jgi:D-arabinono-1,4-lactone oxidase